MLKWFKLNMFEFTGYSENKMGISWSSRIKVWSIHHLTKLFTSTVEKRRNAQFKWLITKHVRRNWLCLPWPKNKSWWNMWIHKINCWLHCWQLFHEHLCTHTEKGGWRLVTRSLLVLYQLSDGYCMVWHKSVS